MATEADGMTLFGPEMLADPYPVYYRHREHQPAFWAPPLDAWVVTSYEAVSAGFRNPRFSSDRFDRMHQRVAHMVLDGVVEDRVRSMIHMDPPEHIRLRGLVNKVLRFPQFALAEGPVEYRNNCNLRGLKTLPVTWA